MAVERLKRCGGLCSRGELAHLALRFPLGSKVCAQTFPLSSNGSLR
jgi:hypothetical protein